MMLVFVLTSCSLFQTKKDLSLEDQLSIDNSEYLDFQRIKLDEFINNNRNKIYKLNWRETKYLEELSHKIIEPNKIFFTGITKPKFLVIKSQDPFYFSLSNEYIVFSSKLITEFIENENILAGLICFELIRIQNQIYPQILTPPLGVTSELDLIGITQIERDYRVTIHEWVYRLIKRTEYDANTYLLWIQIVIRNIKKFKVHFAGYDDVISEERALKAYIINEEKKEGTTFLLKKKSKRTPTIFYSFIERLKNDKSRL